MNSNDGWIPKLTGEAGRPKRGGYILKDTLNWPAKDYMALKVYPPLSVHLYTLLTSYAAEKCV